MKALAPLALAALLLHGSSAPAPAQLIRGQVLLEGREEGVEGVDVALVDATGRARAATVSDSAGTFNLTVPEPGPWVIMASRLGLATVRAEIDVDEKELVEVELVTAEAAIPLEPLVVVARRRIARGSLDEYYDRMERMRARGEGFFFTRTDLERRDRTPLPILLQTAPGVIASPSGGAGYRLRMTGVRGMCTPDVYLDGLPMQGGEGPASAAVEEGASSLYPVRTASEGAAQPRYATIPILDLEGVEIYRGRSAPPEGYWPSDCGIILLWRKRDWGEPFSWGTLLLVGGLGALSLVAITAF
jgi:hypothetical protein